MAAAVFLALAIVSYSPGDPSFNSVAAKATTAKNLCGYFGSFLSDFLLQIFGLSSLLLIIACARMGQLSFKGQSFKPKWWRTVWGGLLMVVISSLMALYFPNARIFEKHILLGGMIGALVSHGLIAIFNSAGVGVLLWATAIVLMIFFTEKRLIELFPWLLQPVKSLAANIKSRFQQSRIKRVKSIEEAIKPIIEAPQFSIMEKLSFIKEKTPVIVKPESQEKSKISFRTLFNQSARQIENWQLPPVDLLLDAPLNQRKIDEREISRNAKLVEQKLAEFDVLGQVVEVKPGPAVTMYEFRPAASIKINDITKLADDLSLALSAESLRIIAPIPGRDVVGIETSNSKRETIYMKEVLESPEFWAEETKLPITLGKEVSGESKIIDLRKIPHLLVAGTTGSGKSVFIMNLVTSLIMRHSPKTLRLIIVDPKQVDLAAFHKVPHLLLPPVKEPKPAVNTLKWLIREMEKRYRSMSRFNSKSLEAFNATVSALKTDEISEHEEKIKLLEANAQTSPQSYYCKPLPYIVTVIEEFADLMSVDRNGVEPVVVRLAQMARASGIHLVIAMQSPRREVLTGLIKTNFPGRISFKVASKVDSSIVLDQRGAERLLSVGDMLYLAPGVSQPQRYHGAFLRDEEMQAVTEFWMKQGVPHFEPEVANLATSHHGGENSETNDYLAAESEEGYDEVVAFVSSQKEVSASLLQRRFRFGYPKAARIIEILENEGVVGPANGSKPRQVLVNRLD